MLLNISAIHRLIALWITAVVAIVGLCSTIGAPWSTTLLLFSLSIAPMGVVLVVRARDAGVTTTHAILHGLESQHV